eukprot:Tbor_TRINITY_DN4972_c3_g3::TRINITY_DN4972_c3_g3_i3::g.9877::m.9877
MDSVLDPRINRYIFHGVTLSLSAAVVFSLLRERWDIQSRLNEPFRALKKGRSSDDVTSALKAILQTLIDDSRVKRADSRISAARNVHLLIDTLTQGQVPKGNAEHVELTIRIIQKAFNDEGSRSKFCKAGGCKALLNVLSKAYIDSNRQTMEEAATTLEMLSEVNEADMDPTFDLVPAGATVAHALGHLPLAIKMLRVLEPTAPVVFLAAATGVFCNITALKSGAKAVYSGIEGRSGMWYFLRLLAHHNQKVVENSARTISFFIRVGLGHEVIGQEDNIMLIADLISLNMGPRTVNAALTVLLLMLESPFSEVFYTTLETKTVALNSLFSVWCRGSERVTRERASVLIRLIERLTPCGGSIRNLYVMNRANIMERQAMDEELKRQEEQQMEKQQMMMRRMGMGMGMGEDMGEFM